MSGDCPASQDHDVAAASDNRPTCDCFISIRREYPDVATLARPARRMHSPMIRETSVSDFPPEKIAALLKIRKLMEWRQAPRPVAPPPPAPAPYRYRHPRTQLGWDGQGAQPVWLRTALLREGYTVEELRRCAIDQPGYSDPQKDQEAEAAVAAQAAAEAAALARAEEAATQSA
jgi:DNA-binding protein H-NS